MNCLRVRLAPHAVHWVPGEFSYLHIRPELSTWAARADHSFLGRPDGVHSTSSDGGVGRQEEHSPDTR